MFCPKCGKINPDNEEICSGCKAPLRNENASAVVKKKGKSAKIVCAVIAVLVIICIAVLVLTSCGMTQPPGEKMTF